MQASITPNPLLALPIIQWRTLLPRGGPKIVPPSDDYWYTKPVWDPQPILKATSHIFRVSIIVPANDSHESIETQYLGNCRRLAIFPGSITHRSHMAFLKEGVRLVIDICDVKWIGYYIFGIRKIDIQQSTAFLDVIAVSNAGVVYDDVLGHWAPFTLECPLDMVHPTCRYMSWEPAFFAAILSELSEDRNLNDNPTA